MNDFYAETSVDLNEFQADPVGMIEQSKGPVALLRCNKPIAYVVPARKWEAVCDWLDDSELADVIRARLSGKAVKVDIADL